MVDDLHAAGVSSAKEGDEEMLADEPLDAKKRDVHGVLLDRKNLIKQVNNIFPFTY
jgi:hypothetical protein